MLWNITYYNNKTDYLKLKNIDQIGSGYICNSIADSLKDLCKDVGTLFSKENRLASKSEDFEGTDHGDYDTLAECIDKCTLTRKVRVASKFKDFEGTHAERNIRMTSLPEDDNSYSFKDVNRMHKPFELLKLNLTHKDIEMNKKIKIENDNNYKYYGKTSDINYQEIHEFISHLDDNNNDIIDSIFRSLRNIVVQFMEYYNKHYRKVDSLWINIRSTFPNNDFKIPRWHADGPYFKTDEGEKTYKFVACLKGPSTLLVSDKDMIEKFRINYAIELEKLRNIKFDTKQDKYKYMNGEMRANIAKVIGSEYHSVPNNYGLIFLVGDRDAVIHSEPNMTTERIFISILPGTQKQIDEWKK